MGLLNKLCGSAFHEFPFCSSINFNSAHLGVVVILVSKGQMTICCHLTTKRHCVAIQAVGLDALAVLSCREQTAMTSLMVSTVLNRESFFSNIGFAIISAII